MTSIMREDWIEIEFGKLCAFSQGIQVSIKEQYSEENEERVRFLRIIDFTQGNEPERYVKKIEGNHIVSKDDISMVRYGTVGFVCTGKAGAIANNLFRIIPNDGIQKKYLIHFLKSSVFRQYLNAKGATMQALSFALINPIQIPLAPLPIQRAIVSKIEALFSDLDNGIANFKKAQEQLKIYRQAVLKKAFEGKLSEPLINNDLSDDTDFKSENKKSSKSFNHKNPSSDNLPKGWNGKLSEPLINDDLSDDTDFKSENEKSSKSFNHKNPSSDNLPKGWKWVNSGELFSFVTSGSRGWAKYYSESGSIFIRITNLNFDTLNLDLRQEKIQYVNPPQNSEGSRTKVEEGDFLFSITGYLGMFAIAPKLESAFVNQHVSLCRPKDFFDKKYLAYWIIAKSGGHYFLNKNQKGAVKAGLNLDDLKNFPVPLPLSIEEQKQIVQEIERRLSVCDKMEQSINESIEKAEALRQSILKKAFEGKLLSQAEIELCKKEADYEPASELLKKITNEKLRITKKTAKK